MKELIYRDLKGENMGKLEKIKAYVRHGLSIRYLLIGMMTILMFAGLQTLIQDIDLSITINVISLLISSYVVGWFWCDTFKWLAKVRDKSIYEETK